MKYENSPTSFLRKTSAQINCKKQLKKPPVRKFISLSDFNEFTTKVGFNYRTRAITISITSNCEFTP